MHSIQKLTVLLSATSLSGAFAGPLGKDSVNIEQRHSEHDSRTPNPFLSYQGTPPGKEVQGGVKLRILSVGASITVGFGKGTDGNGYRKRLRDDLRNKVVWAGTERNDKGDMEDGYFSAWSGKTVKYINDHIDPALEQRPNLILVFAGTNDMNSNPKVSTEGNDPKETAERLKSMAEKMVYECPDAAIILGMITNVCEDNRDQRERTKVYREHIARVAGELKSNGSHVLAANFGPFRDSDLSDCTHPTQEGYQIMGHWWYDFVYQIPKGWIKAPIGPDPVRG
ncbi:hypothetical protein F53441_3953 [Fusarium austroafricanum]|uniref:SGNH hydrolase-type esterase domain-containing protein n=1 Tax=Fusarium austroafricanum TaxID=2364996 RepID=A0A8H4KN85_9HYPO|nr:hypothetical protein F53441_3953 [Fusarium austroafricanum]